MLMMIKTYVILQLTPDSLFRNTLGLYQMFGEIREDHLNVLRTLMFMYTNILEA